MPFGMSMHIARAYVQVHENLTYWAEAFLFNSEFSLKMQCMRSVEPSS